MVGQLNRKTSYFWFYSSKCLLITLLVSLAQGANSVPLRFDSLMDNNFEQTANNSAPIIVIANREGAEEFKQIDEMLANGQYDKLENIARKVMENDAQSGLAYEVLGTVLFMRSNWKGAEDALRKANKLEPTQSGPMSKLGSILMETGKLAEAEKFLKSALNINNNDRIAHQRLGLLYENKKDYLRAEKHLKKGMEGTSKFFVGISVNLGRVLNELNRYHETIRLLSNRVKLASNIHEAHLILGTALLRTSKFSEARERFERVIEIRPNLGAAKMGLGIALRRSGDAKDALSIFESIVTSKPSWRAAQLELGETLLVLNRLEAAKNAFNKAEALGAQPHVIKKRLGEYYVSIKKLDQAQSIFKNIIDTDNADETIYINLSEIEQSKFSHDKAMKWLVRGGQKYPDSALLKFRLGSYLAAMGRYEEAITELERALELAPKDLIALKTLSLAQVKKGDSKGALKTAEKLYESSGGRINEAVYYATRLSANGEKTKAEKVYRDILKEQPNHVIALNNLASILADSKRFKEAEQHARAVNKLVKNNGNLLDTLGWILYQQGKLDEATEVLLKASHTSPDNGTIQYHKGIVLSAKGDSAKARKALEKAIRLVAKSSWLDDAKSQLQKLN